MPRAGKVVVDTRPLWVVLLLRSRRLLLLLGGVLLYVSIRNVETPAGLSPAGQKALAVFALCAFYWVLDVLPLMITSLLAILLLPLTGVLTSKQAYSQFGNEAVFFILGAFILAAAMMKSGLSARIALTLLRRFGHEPKTLLRSIFVLNGIMSFLMSEHAVAAMTFPIILEVVAALQLSRGRSNYGRSLFLAMAWGTTIGGIGTLLGGAWAPLAIGILREVTGESYSFAEWAAANVPVSAMLMVVAWTVLQIFFPCDLSDITAAQAAVDRRLLSIGRMTLQERMIAAVMIATIAAWILLGEEFGLANIALGAVVVLFALGVVGWKDVEGYVNWGLILMYGGAITLGSALNSSGAASWIAHQTISHWASGPASVALLVSAAAIAITEVMSNSAAVAIVMPLGIAVASQFGMDPRIMAPLVAVPAGLSFMLPIGTPANAIAYSSGFLRVRDMMVPGLLLNVTSLLLFNLIVRYYWPLLGIHS
jgi:solute carrier family 13 (sodium-dependent dicarboxylate transporter), member 2/3/5